MDGNLGTPAVQDERRAVPVMEDWANEHEMLRHHWMLLDEYSKAKGHILSLSTSHAKTDCRLDILNEVTSKAEECRYRQYLIECLETTISRKGSVHEDCAGLY